nr:immunoglobulin heavy chain junction region [Macaca mulatta]MOY27025.1 immunoglobulin heavy chain junction region [Macaca mulatta]
CAKVASGSILYW